MTLAVLQSALRETPFAFYARVLGPEGGRRQFLARLGQEADDALDEFLNLALDYERREPPSLQPGRAVGGEQTVAEDPAQHRVGEVALAVVRDVLLEDALHALRARHEVGVRAGEAVAGDVAVLLTDLSPTLLRVRPELTPQQRAERSTSGDAALADAESIPREPSGALDSDP